MTGSNTTRQDKALEKLTVRASIHIPSWHHWLMVELGHPVFFFYMRFMYLYNKFCGNNSNIWSLISVWICIETSLRSAQPVWKRISCWQVWSAFYGLLCFFYSTTGCMSIRVMYRITVVSCSVSLKPEAYCPLFVFPCSIQVAMDSVCPYNF